MQEDTAQRDAAVHEHPKKRRRVLPSIVLGGFALLCLALTTDRYWMRLFREPEKPTLYSAIAEHNRRSLDDQLRSGADPNERDSAGSTPLHAAVRASDAVAIRSLVVAGAEVDAHDHSGRTALQVAARKGDWKIVSMLLRRGAKPDLLDDADLAPLHRAVMAHAKDAVRAFADAGADLDIRSRKWNLTPLLAAASLGDVETTVLLTTLGADIEAPFKGGSRPLHTAASKGHAKVVKALLEAGAQVDARTLDGHTPLMLAGYHGHPHCARLLLSAGADPAAMDVAGRTAQRLAKQAGREWVFEPAPETPVRGVR
jgi:ankyrin repeat protein